MAICAWLVNDETVCAARKWVDDARVLGCWRTLTSLGGWCWSGISSCWAQAAVMARVGLEPRPAATEAELSKTLQNQPVKRCPDLPIRVLDTRRFGRCPTPADSGVSRHSPPWACFKPTDSAVAHTRQLSRCPNVQLRRPTPANSRVAPHRRLGRCPQPATHAEPRYLRLTRNPKAASSGMARRSWDGRCQLGYGPALVGRSVSARVWPGARATVSVSSGMARRPSDGSEPTQALPNTRPTVSSSTTRSGLTRGWRYRRA